MAASGRQTGVGRDLLHHHPELPLSGCDPAGHRHDLAGAGLPPPAAGEWLAAAVPRPCVGAVRRTAVHAGGAGNAAAGDGNLRIAGAAGGPCACGGVAGAVLFPVAGPAGHRPPWRAGAAFRPRRGHADGVVRCLDGAGAGRSGAGKRAGLCPAPAALLPDFALFAQSPALF